MSWVKRFFSKKKGVTQNVVNSLSFKQEMKQDFIPRIWQMAEKEKKHLEWLIEKNADAEMIETSRKYLSHFRQRHKEYNDYVAMMD